MYNCIYGVSQCALTSDWSLKEAGEQRGTSVKIRSDYRDIYICAAQLIQVSVWSTLSRAYHLNPLLLRSCSLLPTQCHLHCSSQKSIRPVLPPLSSVHVTRQFKLYCEFQVQLAVSRRDPLAMIVLGGAALLQCYQHIQY